MSDTLVPLAAGARQSVLRNHNERLLLSMIRQYAPIPASDLTRRVNLSAQTVSVILRDLEREGLLERGEPVRGRVGKPSTPMLLAPEGALSFGMKIGRRSAAVTLMDLAGVIRHQRFLTFPYPEPHLVFDFFRKAYDSILREVPKDLRHRIRGVGLATPYDLWKWSDVVGAPEKRLAPWRETNFGREMDAITDLPVHIMNDATAACRAEQFFGAGQSYQDYAYFFIAGFIGGGIALNGNVLDGNRGNAGALGSLQSLDIGGRPVQLIDHASLRILEEQLFKNGIDASHIWEKFDDWSGYEPYLSAWISQASRELARAALSACAVLDFQAIIIDGAFPADVCRRLVDAVTQQLVRLDARGILLPEIVAGEVGPNARVIGAGYTPISTEFFSASAMKGTAQLA